MPPKPRWDRRIALWTLGATVALVLVALAGVWYQHLSLGQDTQHNARNAAKSRIDELSRSIDERTSWLQDYAEANHTNHSRYATHLRSAVVHRDWAVQNWTREDFALVDRHTDAGLNEVHEIPPPFGDEGRGGVPTWIWIVIGLVVLSLIIGAVVMSGKKK